MKLIVISFFYVASYLTAWETHSEEKVTIQRRLSEEPCEFFKCEWDSTEVVVFQRALLRCKRMGHWKYFEMQLFALELVFPLHSK